MAIIYIKILQKKLKDKFWRYCDNLNSNFSKIYLDEQNKNVYQDITTYYTGLLVHDDRNNKIYAISPLNLYNCIEATIYIYKSNKIQKITTRKVYDIVEFDMSLYEVPYNSKLVEHCIDLEKLQYKLYSSQETENIILKSCLINIEKKIEHDKEIKQLKYNENTFHIDNININFDSIVSKLLIKIPVYIINTKEQIYKKNVSGSLILHNNNVLGIISKYKKQSGEYIGIPSYCIRYIIDLLYNCIDIEKLRSIFIKTSIVTLESINNNEIYHGHYIEDNYGIKSGRIIPKNTYIYKINNKILDENGYIFCDKLKFSVPIDTYILLHNEIKNYTFDIIYNNEKQTMTNINIIPVDYKQYLPVTIKQKSICYIIKGLVFIEASEEFLSSFINIEIEGIVKNEYCRRVSRSNNKLIILVDVLYDKINEYYEEIYKKHNLPFINIKDNKYYIPIIKKINNNKINNITDIEKVIEYECRHNTIILNNDKGKDIKIEINKIISN